MGKKFADVSSSGDLGGNHMVTMGFYGKLKTEKKYNTNFFL